ncbi:MAG TPA: hypothetical protein DDY98_01140 [Ruminococcaceae bacterium]|nr:hypothetical protein [Oscillospiraceae bacterium]
MNNDLFAPFGRPIELCDTNGNVLNAYKAFIQPLRYKNKMYLDGINTEIGFNSQGHYLYLGPPEPDLCALPSGSYLCADSVHYQIDRAEKVYQSDKVFYIWAIIRTITEVNL